MAGYFDDLLDSYRPAAPAVGVDTPWSDPLADGPEPELELPDAPPPATDVAPEPPSPLIAEAHENVPQDRPRISPEPPEAVDPPPRQIAPTITDHPVEREIRVIEQATDAALLRAQVPAAPPPAAEPDHRTDEEPVHSVSRLREEIRVFEERPPPETDAGDPAPPLPPRTPETLAPELPGIDRDADVAAMAAELRRALARLDAADGLPTPFVVPEDFEPERGDALPPPDIETVREVTREIVTEIHHHHHDAAPAPRHEPAAIRVPRTAAEASSIGPIRFASAWKTGGR